MSMCRNLEIARLTPARMKSPPKMNGTARLAPPRSIPKPALSPKPRIIKAPGQTGRAAAGLVSDAIERRKADSREAKTPAIHKDKTSREAPSAHTSERANDIKEACLSFKIV